MGSSGSGALTDYSKSRPKAIDDNNGGTSGNDECRKAFSTSLEDVSRCSYFIEYSDLPPIGTSITIVFNGVRLCAATLKGEEIGYLPTKFNYIRNCISDGFKYGGDVRLLAMTPVPSITVDIIPV